MLVSIAALYVARTQTLYVSAAASLKESFSAISRAFEQSHPGVTVELNFAGSQQLAAQISEGSPCDVFASADTKTISKVRLDSPGAKVFTHNTLVIVTPTRQPGISLRTLPTVHSLVLAAPQVPAGEYARATFTNASKLFGHAWLSSLNKAVVSEEADVRAVLAKVELKEADAGIVYSTDARSAMGKVFAHAIDRRFQPKIEYPIGVPRSAQNSKLGHQFIEMVRGKVGQSILKSFGFVK